MRQIVKQGQRFSRREVSDERGPRRAGGRAVQAGADRPQGRLGRRPADAGAATAPSEVSVEEAVEVGGGAADHLRQPRPGHRRAVLEGPVPRPAPAHHPAHPGVQADALAAARTGGAARRTRSCSGSTAPRGSRARCRTTTCAMLAEAEKRDHRKLGAELDLFSFPTEIGSGLPVFHPKGGDHPPGDGGLLPAPPRGSGLRVRQHPAHDQGGAVPDLRSPGLLRREHVPADGAGGRQVLHEADELPDARADLPVARAVLPGAAAAAVRVRHGVPVREVRRGARADPGPRLHPGRLAHLLHPGAAGPGTGLAAGLRGRPAA